MHSRSSIACTGPLHPHTCSPPSPPPPPPTPNDAGKLTYSQIVSWTSARMLWPAFQTYPHQGKSHRQQSLSPNGPGVCMAATHPLLFNMACSLHAHSSLDLACTMPGFDAMRNLPIHPVLVLAPRTCCRTANRDGEGAKPRGKRAKKGGEEGGEVVATDAPAAAAEVGSSFDAAVLPRGSVPEEAAPVDEARQEGDAGLGGAVEQQGEGELEVGEGLDGVDMDIPAFLMAAAAEGANLDDDYDDYDS
jgi:hypothetical protein